MMEYRFYSLRMRPGLCVGAQEVRLRRGLLMREGDKIVDLCPLPGLHPESLAQAIEGDGPSSSWAHHCFEEFAFDGRARESEIQSAGLFTFRDGPPPVSVPTVVKLKVGRCPIAEEVQWVKAWAGRTQLRLDGNRQLGLEGARRLADAAGSSLMFFEEPARTREALMTLLREFPIALDETLLEDGTEFLFKAAAALVLKPTLLGAEATRGLAAKAGSLGKQIVVSSCYETAVGRWALASFADEVAPLDTHGLGTSAWFEEDIDLKSILQTRFYPTVGAALRAAPATTQGDARW